MWYNIMQNFNSLGCLVLEISAYQCEACHGFRAGASVHKLYVGGVLMKIYNQLWSSMIIGFVPFGNNPASLDPMFRLVWTRWCRYVCEWDAIGLKLMACHWFGNMPLSEHYYVIYFGSWLRKIHSSRIQMFDLNMSLIYVWSAVWLRFQSGEYILFWH